MPRQTAIDLTGQQFGFLTVIRRAGSIKKRVHGSYATWLCWCTCGKEVEVIGQRLRNGLRKACARGHFWASRSERGRGLANRYPSEYRSWRGARERCLLPSVEHYAQYGGRGITICERWKDSFANFLADLGPKPTPYHTIERNNVNGNYEKDNCRWATRIEQSRNMQRSVYVEYEGERLLFIELVKRLGLNRYAVYGRLKNGWSLEQALAIPIRPKKKNRR